MTYDLAAIKSAHDKLVEAETMPCDNCRRVAPAPSMWPEWVGEKLFLMCDRCKSR